MYARIRCRGYIYQLEPKNSCATSCSLQVKSSDRDGGNNFILRDICRAMLHVQQLIKQTDTPISKMRTKAA